MYWTDKMDRLPPNVCRLLAREPHKPKCPLSTEQIAARSGLSKQTIRRISKLKSWATVTVQMQEKFKNGCGVLPGTEAVQLGYLKRSFQKASMPLFHIQKLRKMKKDKRRDKYLTELLTK